jgi:diguanylate cyclase (GGDEF)-like protein
MRFPAPDKHAANSPTAARELQLILSNDVLIPVFQAIFDLRTACLLGHEALIRGPENSSLHEPAALFSTAAQCHATLALERAARRSTVQQFVQADPPGLLFLNVSPDCLMEVNHQRSETLSLITSAGLSPDHVIIELTEQGPHRDTTLLIDAVSHYRRMGFRVALDDLGDGFSSLKLWSQLRPDFVKVDRYFVRDIHLDPVKQAFVRAIQQIASQAGAYVIAEGIESDAELTVIRDLGIPYAQGYFLARPQYVPVTQLSTQLAERILQLPLATRTSPGETHFASASMLLREVPAVAPHVSAEAVYERFARDPALEALPVVDRLIPQGLLRRQHVLETFARRYNHELYSKKPCTALMDRYPMVVDINTSIQALGQQISHADRRYLHDGFILTRNGQYLGMGTGYDLMRELTELQIKAARYANPLTLLPGNVPINEQMDRLLSAGVSFVTAYVDLDSFKPFNDLYGYRRGDDVIVLLAQLLKEYCDREHDFIGHIGGDDFIVLFQSWDWEARCERLLHAFDLRMAGIFDKHHLDAGGFEVSDRRGQLTQFPLTSISIGALRVEPEFYHTHHEIAAAAAGAKHMAKKQTGSSLFIERRLPTSTSPTEPEACGADDPKRDTTTATLNPATV